MIDIVGFWVSVTLIVVLPLWFWGYRITRLILSIAKKNAPEIPLSLRERRGWGHWDRQLYPQWAHNLNACFGGGRFDTGGTAILGIFAFFPCIMLVVGAFHPLETVIGVVSTVSEKSSTVMGWLIVVVASVVGLYIGVSRGSRLIGLVQLQEMKEKGREDR